MSKFPRYLLRRFMDNFREYDITSFKQANKRDAKATGVKAESGGGGKAYASTTRCADSWMARGTRSVDRRMR